jgi:hypothetical protein
MDRWHEQQPIKLTAESCALNASKISDVDCRLATETKTA